VLFAAPVLDPRDQSILGAAVLDADPESLLYPLLRPELLDATTGEIMLARREDDQALFLGPFRPAVSPPSPRVPLSAPGLAMARALAGERYFGEAVDFRGTKVLAMTGHLDEAPWGLVVKVDEAEALTRFRQGVAWQAVVALFLVAGALAMGFGLVRTQRAEREVALASARAQANAELEQRVQERTRQLAEANRDLEAFASSASHDLRAPLRVIDGFARALAEDHGERLDAEGRRILGVVRENARRMAQLIDALLAFSRAGQQELQRATVDMTALVRATYAELRGAEPTEGVELRLAELDPALGDPGLLRQVWANLLSNALKFTRPKGRRTIEVGSRNEALRVVYFVRDNGVGFDMHHAGKLFDVFQRLHGPKEFEGNGIGLALVSRIVSRHGGEVWAEGRPDEGATISFSLPRPNGG
jgi:signal transduction histidine kinase